MNHTIHHDVFIRASKENIFQALSDPKMLSDWWTLKCSGSPRIGAEYNYYFSDEYNWYGMVKGVKLNECLVIQMTRTDEDWDNTVLRFELEPKGSGVNLRFSHSGWKTINHHYCKTSYSWALLLNALKKYLEDGIVIPFTERA